MEQENQEALWKKGVTKVNITNQQYTFDELLNLKPDCFYFFIFLFTIVSDTSIIVN